MAFNHELTKKWIQYLKNNQIVELKSDPNTGKLKYRRSVTAADVKRFLTVVIHVDQERVDKAVNLAIRQKSNERPPETLPKNSQQPENPQQSTPDQKTQQPAPAPAPEPQKSENKPRYRNLKPKTKVNEDFRDTGQTELDEKDVERIFDLINAPSTAPEKKQNSQQPPEQEKQKQKPTQQDKTEDQKIDELNKIKKLIRNTMTPGQRKAFWNAIQ